jgi:hypothetical protein
MENHLAVWLLKGLTENLLVEFAERATPNIVGVQRLSRNVSAKIAQGRTP